MKKSRWFLCAVIAWALPALALSADLNTAVVDGWQNQEANVLVMSGWDCPDMPAAAAEVPQQSEQIIHTNERMPGLGADRLRTGHGEIPLHAATVTAWMLPPGGAEPGGGGLYS